MVGAQTGEITRAKRMGVWTPQESTPKTAWPGVSLLAGESNVVMTAAVVPVESAQPEKSAIRRGTA